MKHEHDRRIEWTDERIKDLRAKLDSSKTIDKQLAQIKHCFFETKTRSLYAPFDGICFFCEQDIYEAIDYDTARETIITGCPHCHRSFVE